MNNTATNATQTAAEALMIQAAYSELNKSYRVLAPAKDAWVEYPAFDPCRARMPIAIVFWPATNQAMREVLLTHLIYDGDRA